MTDERLTHPHLEGLEPLWRARMAACESIEATTAVLACINDLNEALAALPGGGVALLPIERDRAYERDYIPLPGGWEVQTKGKGSTFRIFDPKDGNRLPIPDVPYLHETLTRMARDIHAALAPTPNPHEADRNG